MTPTNSKILIVDDHAENRGVLRRTLEPEGYDLQLAASGAQAFNIAQKARPDLVLLDIMMPDWDGFETCRQFKALDQTRDIPIIFITARDDSETLVKGFEAGAADYITKPFRSEEVLARVATHIRISRLTSELIERNRDLEKEIELRRQAEDQRDVSQSQLGDIAQREAEHWGIPAMIGNSSTFRRILKQIEKASGFGVSRVLITGESGTGKELIARAIHYGGPRRSCPFVPVNCSAIPQELAESLLFGHIKGAFTGATSNRQGAFQSADGGTLFLDEIGDMPLQLQSKLLRVLEDGVVYPVGSSEGKRVDVHIIAASNIDFSPSIQSGQFRQDLYFRLAKFIVESPPLRERREDLQMLTQHFIKLFSREMNLPVPVVSEGAMTALQHYDFPGNVRELKNILERALMECEGDTLLEEHLHFFGSLVKPDSQSDAIPLTDDDAPEAGPPSESIQIIRFVQANGSINNTQCRQLLNVDRNHAFYVLRKLCEDQLLIGKGQGRWATYHLVHAPDPSKAVLNHFSSLERS